MNKLGKGILAKEKYSKFFKVDHGLVTLKMALFAYYGGVACLVPYLTIHMRQIGIDVEQTAIIYAVLPFTTFIGPPLAGFFADRLGRYQVILIMSLFGSAAFHTALLAVAEYQTITKPPLTEFLVSDIISVSVEKCPGQDLPLELAGKNIRWELENCASTCGNGDVPTEYPIGYNISILEYNSTLVLLNNSKSGFYLYRNSNTTAFEEVHGDPIPPCGLNCSANISIYDTEAQTYLPLMCTWKFGNKWFTFGMYFAIRIFSSVFLSISFSLLDATCFALVKEHNSDYGKQKLWSVIATAIFSPITGILIDHVALVTGITDFSPAFYMFDFFVVITVFITFKLECEFENPTDNMIKNVTDLLKSAEVNIFMMIIIVIGCMWGFVETFLYWYMLDLGSPKYLLGLTMTVGSGISIPFMFSSENIVKKIGFVNVLVCSLIFYGVRFVGYSMIYNPWWSLMFEAMEVITLHLMWVSAATYGAHLCPKGLLATMQGAMGGLHHGIGRGLGSFIGGTLITNTGARQSFRIMGVASAVIGIVYLVVYLTYIRKKQGNESKTCETIEMNEAEIKAFKKLAEIEESFVPAKMFGLEYSLSKRSLDSLPECTFTTKEKMKMVMKKRMKKSCQVNRELIPLKLVLFMFAGAIACIFPYLTVHMKQIGLSIEETAIVYAVLPISAFIGPPIAGIVADRLGRFQPVLITCLTISAALYTALLAIPTYEIKENPKRMDIVCYPDSTLFRIQKCAATDICQKSFHVQINTTLGVDLKPMDSSEVIVPILFANETSSDYSNYSQPEFEPHLEIERHNFPATQNNRLPENVSQKYNLREDFTPTSLSTVSLENGSTVEFVTLNGSTRSLGFELYMVNRTRRSELSVMGIEPEKTKDLANSSIKTILTEFSILLASADKDNCYYEIRNFTADDNHFNCSEILIVKETLFGSCTVTKGNNAVTFWAYFLIRNIANIFAGTTFSLLDATSFTIIKEHNADYGKQKLWSTLATAVFSPITGILLDYLYGKRGYMDYAPAFYVFDVCILATIGLSFFLKIAIEEPSGKMMKDVKTLLKNVEIVIYFTMIFFLGAFWGFIETFMYWFLIDLGSSTVLLGLTVTVGSVISLPVLFSSEKIIQRIGNVNVLLMAFLFYALRLMGYSMIYNPWWSLALEFFEVFTLHLMWVAAATYGASIAPKGLLATLQGATGGIHYGIGKGIGSFSGGTMMQLLGARNAFRIMALVSAVCGGTYLVVYFTYLRRIQKVKIEDDAKKCKEKYIEDDKNAEALQTMLK